MSLWTVDFEIWKWFAVARTVEPVSIMYTASSQALFSMVSDIDFPPMLCAAGKIYAVPARIMHLDRSGGWV